MSSVREVVEGAQAQGEDEQVVYTITTTPWGSTPTSPAVVVKRDDTGADVTSTVMPTNSPSILGDVITLSTLKLLTADVVYRVEVKFTTGGNVLECYFMVSAET
jgi:hypothetical protein